jgi:secondary thiamine-phosphate synthase enzyme
MNSVMQIRLGITTRARAFHDVTPAVAAQLREWRAGRGLCQLFLRHTSASLCLTENADPEVQRDLERWARRLAPDGDPLFRHNDEGPDDMPAHVRTLLAGSELSVPVDEGRLLLGTWQGLYVWEHRQQSHRRELVISFLGETA